MRKDVEINKILYEYEEIALTKSNRKRFDVSPEWAQQITTAPGVYVFFEGNNIVYVGESGSLKARMRDVRRTVNHTLRRSIGNKLFADIEGFEKATPKRKFPMKIEEKVDEFMETLHVVIIPVPFGRTEVEEYLVNKFDPKFNSKRKRQSA